MYYNALVRQNGGAIYIDIQKHRDVVKCGHIINLYLLMIIIGYFKMG